jgi:hypothetical protein
MTPVPRAIKTMIAAAYDMTANAGIAASFPLYGGGLILGLSATLHHLPRLLFSR